MAREYLIWSIEHDAWWRPGETGYTRTLSEAGRYRQPRAVEIVARANYVRVHECLIPVDALELGAPGNLTPPNSEHLGDLLQWLAATDPAYLGEVEAHVRAHVATLRRRMTVDR